MPEKKKRPYSPPSITDLSKASAKGQTEGRCAAGPYPYYDCIAGPVYLSSCGGGGTVDVSECQFGGTHYYPACDTGDNAVTACLSGQNQNF